VLSRVLVIYPQSACSNNLLEAELAISTQTCQIHGSSNTVKFTDSVNPSNCMMISPTVLHIRRPRECRIRLSGGYCWPHILSLTLELRLIATAMLLGQCASCWWGWRIQHILPKWINDRGRVSGCPMYGGCDQKSVPSHTYLLQYQLLFFTLIHCITGYFRGNSCPPYSAVFSF
jgi:hypothetical protein